MFIEENALHLNRRADPLQSAGLMETRLLKMFCSVAETGSLVAAASQLHLTPSAVSHSLKNLETDLGCRLFHRVGKKLVMNQAGEQLLAQIKQPLAALEAAQNSLRQLARWGQTRLRLGAAASTCQYVLPSVIRELKKSFPKVTLQVESGDTPEMVEHIEQNRLDLVLGVAPQNPSGLDVRPIFKDELLFTFSPAHPWADGKPISRDEIRLQPLIVYQRHSVTTRLLDDYFRSLDLVPTTVMEIDNMEAIKELVKLNLGVSLLAPWTAGRELAAGSLRMRPPGPRPLRREWAVMSLAGRRLALVEETFVKLCRTAAAALRLDRKDIPAWGR
ncbi:MAG: LysR family transcriptional regulator [Verrucomicrobia subdivision 3 bacterium]|nr:LysR family transcriptional regulator [Limisphaerales bacterium]